ncbi:MAG: TPM domain-containing protein [Bacteroidales bacterium]|nr:TPM domain-containing protein [Bacteroidales bacterium]
MKASTFLTKEQQSLIRNAIIEAEESTSGEIRVHIETGIEGEVLDRAAWIFKKIGMHKTEDRNGVLFYLALNNREFAIIGDAGINAKVKGDFWDEVKIKLEKNFSTEKFTEGLAEGILMTGLKLKEYFPREKNDINELPDEISFEDDLNNK